MNSERTTIIVVRHGETEWNRAGKYQGCDDSPLTELGIEQAQKAAFALKRYSFDHLYTSNLGRALQTAQIIGAELALTPRCDERLRERNLGVMQGLTADEFKLEYPDEFERYSLGDPDYSPPNGESARESYQRCTACFEELARRHQNENILIVSHGWILDNLFRWVLGIPLETKRRFSLKNCSINRFYIIKGNWKLDIWGECNDNN